MTAPSRLGRPMFALLFPLLLAALAASPAQATLAISNQATKNIKCKNGICKATAHFAVLNAGDLAGMLASGDITVRPGTRALDIDVKAPFSWASASRLTLDAYHSITIARTVTVAGPGALTITTNDGGSGGDYVFADMGRVTFWDVSSSLIINGTSFTLANSIATLASAIAAHPVNSFALANNYDAGVDGTYGSTPSPTTLFGGFEGLGNTISNLSMSVSSGGIALFADVRGRLGDIRLTHAHATNTASSNGGTALLVGSGQNLIGDQVAGTISAASGVAGGMTAALRGATVKRSSANVRITGTAFFVGGLAGEADNGTFISFSHADGNVAGTGDVGGLIGLAGNQGAGAVLSQDFATGTVSGDTVGGLVGYNEGQIDQSYATGAVSGTGVAGGFVGRNDFHQLTHNYAIGHVQVQGFGPAGGFAGCDQFNASFDYWDTETAGVNVGEGGCANSDLTIGLTTAQFQSGLPNGFDPTIWAEDPSINNGFPYLIANPPQ